MYPARTRLLALLFAVAVSSAALVSLSPVEAWSQTAQQKAQGTKKGTTATPGRPSPATPVVPSDEVLLRLICSTVIALNQANATGNYSVFRELSAPGFQVANSTGQLTETFAKLRSRNFDLSTIVLLQPKLLSKPAIDARGMLRVTGFFPTQPERLDFDLMYQFVEGQWRLFGIAADTTPVQPTTALGAPQPEPSTSTSNAAPPLTNAPTPAKPETQSNSNPEAKQDDVRNRVDLLEAGAAAPKVKDAPTKAFSPFTQLGP